MKRIAALAIIAMSLSGCALFSYSHTHPHILEGAVIGGVAGAIVGGVAGGSGGVVVGAGIGAAAGAAIGAVLDSAIQ
jgi:hypothetical protein